jgi:CBS domain containing-hemolysin-like protein
MFIAEMDIGQIGRLIQIAMAPAFLLMATGNILTMFAGRLARVVDRERVQMKEFNETEGEAHIRVVNELRLLDRRAAIVNLAILMGTLSAVTVGLVIASIFVLSLTGYKFGLFVAGGFILAMVFLITGLILFIAEIRLATRNIRIEERLLTLDEDQQ